MRRDYTEVVGVALVDVRERDPGRLNLAPAFGLLTALPIRLTAVIICVLTQDVAKRRHHVIAASMHFNFTWKKVHLSYWRAARQAWASK